jgi:hypothetical protein
MIEQNEVVVKTIPKSLMPDENNQFLDSASVSPSDDWMFYDSWDMELAVKLITLGYPVSLKVHAEMIKDWPDDAAGKYRFYAMWTVYSRARNIAESSMAIGKIKDPDTPTNWIEWAKGKGYNTDHLDPLKNIQKFELALLEVDRAGVRESYQEQIQGWKKLLHMRGFARSKLIQDSTAKELNEPESKSVDYDAKLAALFDPVPHTALSSMFPSKNKKGGDNWSQWHRKAKECGLITARANRGVYNPYLAAKWWFDVSKPEGWDWSRCLRKLAASLPSRSKDDKHLLIGYE